MRKVHIPAFIIITFMLFSFYMPVDCGANPSDVIFSDNFDDQPDWDMSQSPGLLNGWDGSLGRNRGGNYEVGYINSDGARGNGKGFIQYWDTASVGYAQDSWLYLDQTHLPDEFYVGFWLQIDPNWDWGDGVALKLFRIFTADGGSITPVWARFCQYCEAEWSPSYNPKPGCGFSIGQNSLSTWASCWNEVADGNWHYFIFHFVNSTGVYEVWVDGADAVHYHTTANYIGRDWSTSGLSFAFGGNMSDGGGAVNEMWTKYDDVIVATSKQAVEDFLGVDYSDDFDGDFDVDGNDLALLAMQIDSEIAGIPEVSSFAGSFSVRR